MLIGN